MQRNIDFYFDYLSPYAYLAWLCLPEVCEKRDVAITPHPVLFAGLLDHWGQLGPAEIPPKGQHALRECARFAALRGIAFRSPRFHPFRPLTALRVSLAASKGQPQADVIGAIFRAGWAEGRDLGDATVIGAAVAGVGLDADALLADAETPDVKQRLRDETESAVGVGVFGIPTMRIDGELFWGLDQLQYLGMCLDGADPLKDIDFAAIVPEGRAAERPASLDQTRTARDHEREPGAAQ